MEIWGTGCEGSGVRSGYDPLPSLSPGPGSARAHNIQPQLEPANAGLGERKSGPSVLFYENPAGKRITGLKGTEDSGSNTASKWGRSVLQQSRDYPGRHPGTNAWSLQLDTWYLPILFYNWGIFGRRSPKLTKISERWHCSLG